MANGNGSRERLAQLVEEKKKELLSRNAGLSELEAHRRAIDLAVKGNIDLLKSYRMDVSK
jgi:hypothetical protein